MFAAVNQKSGAHALEFASAELRADPEVVLSAVQECAGEICGQAATSCLLYFGSVVRRCRVSGRFFLFLSTKTQELQVWRPATRKGGSSSPELGSQWRASLFPSQQMEEGECFFWMAGCAALLPDARAPLIGRPRTVNRRYPGARKRVGRPVHAHSERETPRSGT